MKNNIAGVRKARGIKQKELAEMLGIKVATLGTWERGKYNPTLEQAWDIADVLKCSLDELAGRKWSASSDLAPDEERLLDDYRSMTKRQRDGLMAFLPTVSDGGSAKNSELPTREAI